jgi:hypothetical protein
MKNNSVKNIPFFPSHCQELSLKQKLFLQAQNCGPAAIQLIEEFWLANTRKSFRSGCQIMGLARFYGSKRLEAACQRAIYYNRDKDYATIKWILENNYDLLSLIPYSDVTGQLLFDLTHNHADSE